MIETIGFILTGIGLTASIIYYANILQNANKTQQMTLENRQAQLFMQLFDRLASEENRARSMQILQLEFTGYDDFEEKYNMETSPEMVSKVLHIWQELNGMGFLLRKGLVDIETVYHLAGHIVVLQWNKWSQYISEARVREKEPDFLDEFEYLSKELRRYRSSKTVDQ